MRLTVVVCVVLGGCGDDSGGAPMGPATIDARPDAPGLDSGGPDGPLFDGACPLAGDEPSLGCATESARQCSGDAGETIVCQSSSGCLVWVTEDPCSLSGLSCVTASTACECPAAAGTDFYANPVVDRSARPTLVETGVRSPAICAFETMNAAIAAATTAGAGARAVAADDSPPSGWDGVARFTDDLFPWIVPNGLLVTTLDDSAVGGSDDFEPSRWVVVVDNDDADTGNSASVELRGGTVRTGDGGILRGFTFVEGSCAGAVCNLPATAVRIEGYGGTEPRLAHVVVSGGGGPIALEGTAGTIAGSGSGPATFTAATADVFAGRVATDGYFLELRGSGDDNDGWFAVRSFGVDGESITYHDPGAASETFTGSWVLHRVGDWDIGVEVEGNAVMTDLRVADFAFQTRIGVFVMDDFGDMAGDEVRLIGGRYVSNDIGIQISGGSVFIDPVGSVPAVIDASTADGLVAIDGFGPADLLAVDLSITGSAQRGVVVSGLANVELDGGRVMTSGGTGVVVEGSLLADTVEVSGNAGDGVRVNMTNVLAQTTLTNCTVRANGADGIDVRAAPFSADFTGAPVPVHTLESVAVSGLQVDGGTVIDNIGDGLAIGLDAQTAKVFAGLNGVAIHGNGGAGVRAVQNAGRGPLGTTEDCTGLTDGCTALTMEGNDIHDNVGGGVVLRTLFLKSFETNSIHHNALATAAVCTGQTAPQVSIAGPVAFRQGPCAGLNDVDCAGERNTADCLWTGTTCLVAWDLSRPTCDASINSFYSYEDRGLAVSNNGIVDADNNTWRFATQPANVQSAAGSFVDADEICDLHAACD